MKSNTYTSTTYMVMCGLFAALNAICAQIFIPLAFTPVPVNLGTLGVFLTGGLLGRKYGVISIGVYVLLGAAGVPVFAGFRGGLGVLAGPTGGYILGYLLAVLIVGMILDKGYAKLSLRVLSMAAGLAACYCFGTLWFMVSTGTGFDAAFVSCILPFIPGDIVKILAASFLIKRLRPRIG
jgi:biotin transport system substrate-specific component